MGLGGIDHKDGDRYNELSGKRYTPIRNISIRIVQWGNKFGGVKEG